MKPPITPEEIARVRAVPHFGDSHYASWDLAQMLHSYEVMFVEPLIASDAPDASWTVADVGTGYGWLAIAFARRTEARIIAIDFDAARLKAAEAIAAILGVADRIEFRVGSVGVLPMHDREADATYCVEVIEHTGTDPAIVRDLARVTRRVLTVTTPNKVFPVIGHDTRLPFCHWLPIPLRNLYASLFGRRHAQDSNQFWSPGKLLPLLDDFDRESRFFQFRSYDAFRDAWSRQAGPPSLKRGVQLAYFRWAALLGRGAIYALPNLASVWRRRA